MDRDELISSPGATIGRVHEVEAADACETIAARVADAPLVLASEHASAALPSPWKWSAEDEWLLPTHWASDLGAAELTRELAAALGAAAVLARFSRLLIDPNRPLESATLLRTHADGREVALNRRIATADADERVGYWRAYHDELDRVLGGERAGVVLSVHSYTPLYQGQRRDYGLGVLFDREEGLGQALARAVAPLGEVRLNEPYSGKAGLIYSAQRHADETGKRAVEIEVRQDLAIDPGFRRRLVQAIAAGGWLD